MRKYFSILLAILLLSACGIDNTMYNARNYFKSAQEKPLNANGRPNPQAVDEYTKAIRKCGIILSDGGKGPRAPEALYLMARSLYYKGNSAFQAKDAFENLIKGYPNSKFVPDAYIYLAKVMREVNQIKESEALLESFVRNPKYLKQHPKALLVLADFEIKDKDYIRAQYWLQRIITDYPKTKEFREASYLFGKNYYMQGDFATSKQEFERFIKARGIDKEMKLEANYWIALNQYELKDYEHSQRNVKALIRNEVRPDKLSQARVLNARILLATADTTKAFAEIDAITKAYPRTEHSAAAYFYLGEYQYYQIGDIAKAVQNLNRVRTEFSTSPFANTATQKATALNQLNPKAILDSETKLQEFLDHHYLRAEYFLSPLALADSALASYQTVISEKDHLVALKDSLQIQIDSLSVVLDSMKINLPIQDESAAPQADTLQSIDQPETKETEAPKGQDEALEASPEKGEENQELLPLDTNLLATSTPPDTLITTKLEPISEPVQPEILSPKMFDNPVLIDSLKTIDKPLVEGSETIAADSLQTEIEAENADVAKPDATIEPVPVKLTYSATIDSLENVKTQLVSRVEKFPAIFSRFDTEIIPFCYFAQISLMHNSTYPAEQTEAKLAQMREKYPRNRYTNAAIAIRAGKIPQLIDPDLEAALDTFDMALAYYPEFPDSLTAKMLEFTSSPFPDIKLRANYRLGWHYSFENPDTTLAKEYLQEVLDSTNSADYGSTTRRFFDGVKFLLRDSGLVDSLSADVDSLLLMPDSLAAFSDSLLVSPDSLQIGYTADVQDSLAVPVDNPDETTEEKPLENHPDAIKEEDIQPE